MTVLTVAAGTATGATTTSSDETVTVYNHDGQVEVEQNDDDDNYLQYSLLNLNINEGFGERLIVPEWNDNNNYRKKNGWRGRDLVHDKNAPVRVKDYYIKYGSSEDNNNDNNNNTGGGIGTVLTGIVIFTKYAESHIGFCHGGSMCSIMDDVVGWVAFCVTGSVRPWTGFTVQINTKLQRPIPVNSTLIVQATITNIIRRKVYVTAKLYNPNEIDDEKKSIHATCDGIVVMNKGILLDDQQEKEEEEEEPTQK